MNKRKTNYDKQATVIKDLEHTLAKKREQLTNKQQTIAEKNKRLNQGYRLLAKEKSRSDMLQEMKEDYQGFFYGVKAILQANENKELANIIGPLVELIDVPKKFLIAIETDI